MSSKFLKSPTKIKAWLEKHKIEKYILTPNSQYGYVVEVFTSVEIKEVSSIPVKFNWVAGNFDCWYNQLTDLDFAPRAVGGDFNCSHNQLTTLGGCPQVVGKHVYCHNNQLLNLKGAPTHILGNFECSDNTLTTLEFCPETVAGNFGCTRNKIRTLEFCPQTVGGDFSGELNCLPQELEHEHNFQVIYAAHRKIAIIKEEQKLLLSNVKASQTHATKIIKI